MKIIARTGTRAYRNADIPERGHTGTRAYRNVDVLVGGEPKVEPNAGCTHGLAAMVFTPAFGRGSPATLG